MRKTNKIIAAGLAAATLVTGLSVATTSSAESWRGGHAYRYSHDRGGSALAAGIAGLALGAALAGGSGSYYAAPRYAYGPRYVYAPAYAYPPGYYYRPHRRYARACEAWRYDYWGRPYRVAGWC